MKRPFATLFLCFFPPLACAQSSPTAGPAASPDKESCSISGVVVRQDNGQPLSKAKVTLINHEKWEESTVDLTDAQGHFSLDDLQCIPFSMSVSHSGFVEASYGQRKPADPGAVLTLAPGQKMTGLIFKLRRAAVIAGRVFDENGDLVEGAFVRAIHGSNRTGHREFDEAGTDSTNDLKSPTFRGSRARASTHPFRKSASCQSPCSTRCTASREVMKSNSCSLFAANIFPRNKSYRP